jgi:phenylpyruvate tautomerase PptA (4-oxalocrotonate tautomerase family)
LLKLFPNPAHSELVLEYNGFQNKQLIITDVLGRTQKTLPLQSETTTVNIQDLPNGIYYLSIYESNSLLGSRKFVVLHE